MTLEINTYRSGGTIHFVGCGGVGMRPLMKIYSDLGFNVSGSDSSCSPELESLGEVSDKVFLGHDASNLPDCDSEKLLLVYSSAVTPENPEYAEALRRGCVCIRRGELLGLTASLYPSVIAVTGSHGKTSVTALIVHILEKLGFTPGYLIGGNITGRKWNGAAGDGSIFVCEADESDGTHIAVKATTAVVTNIEDDHVWNFNSFDDLLENFKKFGFHSSSLVYNTSPRTCKLYSGHPKSLNFNPEMYLDSNSVSGLPHYQKLNAATAAAALEFAGFGKFSKALEAAADFPGVERRMSLRCDSHSVKLLEDYAHHPTEVKASLTSLREMYPGRRLVVIFQPHRFARLKRYFNEFAETLSAVDKVYIAPVFAAWVGKSDVTSQDLANAVNGATALSGSWNDMAGKVFDGLLAGDAAAVIGAGDVKEIIEPLSSRLKDPKVGLIVAAGGSSTRFGGENKLLKLIAGRPVFIHCIANFAPRVSEIIMAAPSEMHVIYRELLDKYLPEVDNIRLVPGGKTRSESVANALAVLSPQITIAAVHDAARPLADSEILGRCVSACGSFDGAVAAVKLTDTVKIADKDNIVLKTPPREMLWAVQTPQVFRTDILKKAYELAGDDAGHFTDDSSIVEAFTDGRVKLLESSSLNLKITYNTDITLAEYFMKNKK